MVYLIQAALSYTRSIALLIVVIGTLISLLIVGFQASKSNAATEVEKNNPSFLAGPSGDEKGIAVGACGASGGSCTCGGYEQSYVCGSEQTYCTNTVCYACPTAAITASPNPVAQNGQSLVDWTCGGGTTAAYLNGSYVNGSVDSAFWTGPLASSVSYQLQCTNPAGFSAYASVIVNVNAPPPPPSNPQCSDGVDNADAEDSLADGNDPGCHSDGNTGNSASYNPNDNDESNSAAPPPPPPPSGDPWVDIKADGSNGPISIAYNTDAALTWTSNDVNSCTVNPGGWTGIANGGVSTGNLTSSQTYTINCSGDFGPASDDVEVNVGAAPTFPNLQAGVPSVSGTLVAWESITFSGNIHNPSGAGANASANGSFENRFRYRELSGGLNNAFTGSAWHTVSVDGSSPTSAGIPGGLAPGDYEVDLCVDSGDDIAEWNNDDNCGGLTYFTIESQVTNASCSASPASQVEGQPVNWSANASGGSQPYQCSWSGDVSGSSCQESETYSIPPGPAQTKTANVRVSSNGNASNFDTAQCTVQIRNPQCSDGVDNGDPDSPAVSDGNDPGCWTDPTDPGSYNPNDDDESAASSPPTLTLNANPKLVNPGQTATVTWSATNVTSCTVAGGSYNWTGVTGTQTPVINQTTTFTLTCVNVDGNFHAPPATVTVRINPNVREE